MRFIENFKIRNTNVVKVLSIYTIILIFLSSLMYFLYFHIDKSIIVTEHEFMQFTQEYDDDDIFYRDILEIFNLHDKTPAMDAYASVITSLSDDYAYIKEYDDSAEYYGEHLLLFNENLEKLKRINKIIGE